MKAIRIVEVVVQPGSWRLCRREAYMVVEYSTPERGCLGEPSVRRLWQSDDFASRSSSPRGERVAQYRKAQEFARHARLALRHGFDPTTPAGVLADWLEEQGLAGTGPVGDDRPVFLGYLEREDDRRPA